MKFGMTMQEDARKRAQSSEASETGGKWIKGFGDGVTTVRFLEEIDAWTAYWEHYNEAKKRYYPCTGDRNTCPGCTSEYERESRASKRYLVNAMNVDTEYIDLYKVPVSLIERLQRSADANGSITNRDYLITRSGKAPQIEYDREADEKYHVNIDPLREKFTDHQAALRDAYVETWGALPDVESEAEAPQARKARATSSAAKAKAAKPDAKPAVDEDKPPSEPQSSSADTTEGEDEVLSEETVRDMSVAELLDLFQRCGLQPKVSAMGKGGEEYRTALADQLINDLGE